MSFTSRRSPVSDGFGGDTGDSFAREDVVPDEPLFDLESHVHRERKKQVFGKRDLTTRSQDGDNRVVGQLAPAKLESLPVRGVDAQVGSESFIRRRHTGLQLEGDFAQLLQRRCQTHCAHVIPLHAQHFAGKVEGAADEDVRRRSVFSALGDTVLRARPACRAGPIASSWRCMVAITTLRPAYGWHTLLTCAPR